MGVVPPHLLGPGRVEDLGEFFHQRGFPSGLRAAHQDLLHEEGAGGAADEVPVSQRVLADAGAGDVPLTSVGIHHDVPGFGEKVPKAHGVFRFSSEDQVDGVFHRFSHPEGPVRPSPGKRRDACFVHKTHIDALESLEFLPKPLLPLHRRDGAFHAVSSAGVVVLGAPGDEHHQAIHQGVSLEDTGEVAPVERQKLSRENAHGHDEGLLRLPREEGLRRRTP